MEREPDVEIAAAARFGDLRLECRPEVRVVVYANVDASAESVSERENLPDQLEPGVTYRGGGVRRRIAAWLESPS